MDRLCGTRAGGSTASTDTWMIEPRRERVLDRLPPVVGRSRVAVRIFNLLWSAARELKTLIFIGPRIVALRLRPGDDRWRAELPVQAVSRWRVPAGVGIADTTEFRDWAAAGGDVGLGQDSFYLAPLG